ncbi:KOW domain-containing RNA-binding protein [Sporolituus thermophilus]|uniref:Ribosomal protein L14E/L6E/L27E n=1 Tax=Sporolituus thermophilus DSM 23256 TaxID=1123285 RepID=A0A1G7LN20_9FIRM|nr:KOW domain-containing RNA-binding protein [Sporolituus thermophilus]SDF50922.1 hypothetical protein SAMN05660235_01828 [Sporolituus thermophilus DSM 23256]
MAAAESILGQIVASTSGRDAGHVYVVVGLVPPNFLLLADGRGRRIANPKKKNVRHVKRVQQDVSQLADKFRSGAKVTDEDLRQALATIGSSDKQ